MKNCEVCGKEHSNKRATCSEECKKTLYNQKVRENRAKQNGTEDDNIKCKICGQSFKSLNFHLKKVHSMSLDEYKEKFNLTNDDCYSSSLKQFMSDSMKGDKNPAFGHGGKLSPFSKNFVKYDGLSDEEKQVKLDEINLKQIESMQSSDKMQTRIEYYLAQGMSVEDAKIAQAERQSTFSLKKCFEKYGEVEGQKVFDERQKKWQDNLNSKSDEEQERITRLKITGGNGCVSKVSMELFNKLSPHFNNVRFGKKSETNRGEKMIKFGDKKMFVDFHIEGTKKIIEFFGDYWHCNPRFFSETSSNKGRLNTIQIWNRDKERIEKLTENGFEVLVIWEFDYNQDKESTIEKCLEFLRKE